MTQPETARVYGIAPRLVGALFALLAAGCSRLHTPEPLVVRAGEHVEGSGPLVVFLGDSLAAGLYLPPEHAFPAVAQRALSRDGVPFELANAGVSGDTTEGGLLRLPALLAHRPEVVVIELGANDGLRRVPLDVMRDNLRAIVGAVKRSGATPLLLGIRLPPRLVGQPYSEAFSAVFPVLAHDLDVLFVASFLDGVGGEPTLNLEDGMHPNPRGHERLAQNIAPRLREALARAGSSHPAHPEAQPD